MVSRECYERIFDKEIVSNEIVGVVGCINDQIQINHINVTVHKEKIGLMIVSADIISIIVLFIFFWQIKKINSEYIDILDSNVINIQDFSFEIKNLDTAVNLQDFRTLKMKLWIHLSDLISHINIKKEDEASEEPLKIVDI